MFKHNVVVHDLSDIGVVGPNDVDEVKKTLIAPYRVLRDCDDITFEGLPDALSKEVITDIAQPAPTLDPTEFLAFLRDLKEEGSQAWKDGNDRCANNLWRHVVEKLHIAMTHRPGERLRAKGGPAFVDSLFEIEFAATSNIALAHLKNLRRSVSHHRSGDLISAVSAEFFSALQDAKFSRAKWPEGHGGTWEATPAQMAKLLYRESVGCSLMGKREGLEQAEWVINLALRESPGDSKVLEEKVLIDAWRARVDG